METKSNVGARKRNRLILGKKGIAILMSLLMLVIVVPSTALADYADGLLEVEFRVGDSVVKTVSVEIPEGAEAISLPTDAIPTAEDILAASESQSGEPQILGWKDSKDETETIYTADESLAETEGYAPIGGFVLFEDTIFEAVIAPTEPVAEVAPAANEPVAEGDAEGVVQSENQITPPPWKKLAMKPRLKLEHWPQPQAI